MSAKKNESVKKAAPAKAAAKPSAKKPAAKPAAPAKPAAKKPAAPAKKPAKPEMKKHERPVLPPPIEFSPDRGAKVITGKNGNKYVRKPITVVDKTPKVPLKKPEVIQEFENHSQDMAFSFAERMKERAREAAQASANTATGVRLTRRPTTRTKGEASLQFPAADLAEFRKRLLILRQEVLGKSTTLKTVALEQTNDHGSEDEDGSDAFMRLQDLRQVETRNKMVRMIDEALNRIAEGKYGICEICGQLIRKPRLLNLPFVHTCMECQTAMERRHHGRR